MTIVFTAHTYLSFALHMARISHIRTIIRTEIPHRHSMAHTLVSSYKIALTLSGKQN